MKNEEGSTVGLMVGLMVGLGIIILICGILGAEKDNSVAVGDDTEVVAYTFEGLLDAIEWVESKGDPGVIGADGEVGAFQISKIYVDDVNRIAYLMHKDKYSAPISWEYFHRKSLTCSRWMVNAYLTHYGGTIEEMARKHNGGPDGWRDDPEWFVRNRGYTLEEAKSKIANTKAYWVKIKERLDAQNNR